MLLDLRRQEVFFFFGGGQRSPFTFSVPRSFAWFALNRIYFCFFAVIPATVKAISSVDSPPSHPSSLPMKPFALLFCDWYRWPMIKRLDWVASLSARYMNVTVTCVCLDRGRIFVRAGNLAIIDFLQDFECSRIRCGGRLLISDNVGLLYGFRKQLTLPSTGISRSGLRRMTIQVKEVRNLNNKNRYTIKNTKNTNIAIYTVMAMK